MTRKKAGNMKDVLVIGGGASGLAAAIAAARAGAHVSLLEAGEHVGRPILATGNGRCNLTNMLVTARDYSCPGFVEPTLARYGADDVLGFFRELGLVTAEEGEGRVYPLSRSASSVVDVLRGACARLGVETNCGARVQAVRRRAGGGFRALAGDGRAFEADAVVVATGGGTDLLAGLGHEMRPFRPVLCSLATDTRPLRGLDGVRVRTQVNAFHPGEREPFAHERGEVLFRKYGLSGIVVFDLSRLVESGDSLSLDLLPDVGDEEAAAFVSGLLARQLAAAREHDAPRPSYAELLSGFFHPRVAGAVLRSAGLKPSLSAELDGVKPVVHRAKHFRVRVEGVGDAKHAQVTRGGATVGQFDSHTLESKVAPGLFACGETLDVDGPCGGYNLHWAWASGLVSGASAAQASPSRRCSSGRGAKAALPGGIASQTSGAPCEGNPEPPRPRGAEKAI